jgi:SH3-like domain-containing protein
MALSAKPVLSFRQVRLVPLRRLWHLTRLVGWEEYFMRYCAVSVIVVMSLLATAALAQKKPPYWASISAGKARMRTGPGQQFPASWLYQRAGLPVKVLETYPNWRKIEDPDGIQGWMQANLLSETPTALVRGDVQPLRERPDPESQILWRAEPGVVGKVSDCAKGWCRLDVLGRMGYIEATHIWGGQP